MSRVYCTSYCNHGHDVKTGNPVDHECHVIPPKALEAEMAGDVDKALEIIRGLKPLRPHRGMRSR